MIYFLFASHCAVGCLLTLNLVPVRDTGGGFPRFISGVALFFLAGALVAGGLLSRAAWSGGARGVPLILYAAALLPTAANAFVKGDRPRARSFLLGTATLLAVAGFLADTLLNQVPAGAGSGVRVVTVLSFMAAALAAGSVCVAMILGHFYLVIPRLPIRPLILLCGVLVISLLARLVMTGVAIVTWGSQYETPRASDAVRFVWQNLAVEEGLIFWPRLLAGLVAPLLLAVMAWRTARIRSTQSATGLLYIAIVFTTIGEFLGRFLFLTTRLPL
jgi:hypothetical protein